MIAGQQDDVRVVTLREAVQDLVGGMGGACGAGESLSSGEAAEAS